jgi:hypothetical protein
MELLPVRLPNYYELSELGPIKPLFGRVVRYQILKEQGWILVLPRIDGMVLILV